MNDAPTENRGRALRDLLADRWQTHFRADFNATRFAKAMHKPDAALLHKYFRGEVVPGPDTRDQMVEAATSLGLDLTLEDIADVYGDEPRPYQLTLAEAIKSQADAIWALVRLVNDELPSRVEQAVREGALRDLERQGDEDPRKPVPKRRKPLRGTGAGP